MGTGIISVSLVLTPSKPLSMECVSVKEQALFLHPLCSFFSPRWPIFEPLKRQPPKKKKKVSFVFLEILPEERTQEMFHLSILFTTWESKCKSDVFPGSCRWLFLDNDISPASLTFHFILLGPPALFCYCMSK